jgi:DNA-binding response OmpR family regulator
MKLLLIENDSDIVIGLYRALSRAYSIDCVATGRAGLQKIAHQPFDLIILDLELPDISGLRICELVRSNGLTVPILALGNDDISSKVTVLDSGANDYVTKPFERAELEARMRVLTRRGSTPVTRHSRLVVGDLILDTVRHIATRNGVPVTLRRKEFAILECLMRNAGRVVTSTILSTQAWEEGQDLTNTLHVHIKHLRDKIDRPFKTTLIKTVHGFGYRLEAPTLGTEEAWDTKLASRKTFDYT